jgi:hypothetical protein
MIIRKQVSVGWWRFNTSMHGMLSRSRIIHRLTFRVLRPDIFACFSFEIAIDPSQHG